MSSFGYDLYYYFSLIDNQTNLFQYFEHKQFTRHSASPNYVYLYIQLHITMHSVGSMLHCKEKYIDFYQIIRYIFAEISQLSASRN